MDPLYICVAFSPLAIYLLVIGLINVRPRPLVVSGFHDAVGLGLGISGFALAGPLELFLPEPAAFRYGPLAWAMLVVLYVLLLALVVLMQRPRLVLYNSTLEELRPVLARVLPQVDPQARWMGDHAVLPQLGVQFHMEQSAWMRNMQLVSTGSKQDFAGWRRLQFALVAALAKTTTHRNPRAMGLVLTALCLAMLVATNVIRDPQAIAQALHEMLRM